MKIYGISTDEMDHQTLLTIYSEAMVNWERAYNENFKFDENGQLDYTFKGTPETQERLNDAIDIATGLRQEIISRMRY